jgi:hypothetical protein
MKEVFIIRGNVPDADEACRTIAMGLQEYKGVSKVLASPDGAGAIVVEVEYDETGSGEFDDSALLLLEDRLGLEGLEAEWVERPKWNPLGGLGTFI